MTGGTNDMVIHEVLDNGKIKELLPADGGEHGGNKINENVINLLKNTFGDAYIMQYENNNFESWVMLQNNIEKLKKSIDRKDKKYTLELPYGFIENFNGTKLPLPKGVGLTDDDDLEFSREGIDYLFNETIAGIKSDLSKMLQNKPTLQLRYIIMVGGFSHSALVVKAIRDQFERGNCKVIVPHGSQTAVMQGAVLFAMHQNQVESRIARKTYGFDGCQPFNPRIHSDKHRYIDSERNVRCCDIFVPLIQKGDAIAIDYEHTHTYRILKDQTTHIVTIYELDRTTYGSPVVYTDSHGVLPVGTVTVDIPTNTWFYATMRIVLGLKFGQTELAVQAYDEKTKAKLKTAFKFVS